MSTGLDCYFEEKNPSEWYLFLEQWERRDEYDKYGPFSTFAEAEKYLKDNFANPGGFSVEGHPDSTDTSWKDGWA